MDVTLRELAQQTANVVEATRKRLDATRKRIADKELEIVTEESAPVPIEEQNARIKAGVMALHRKWLSDRARFSSLFVSVMRYGAAVDELAAHKNDDMMSFEAACGLRPQQVISEIMQARDAMTSEKPGSSSKSRPDLIERKKSEKRDLERTEIELVDALIAAGIKVEHRSEVQNARRRRQEELDAWPARRAALLNSAEQNLAYYRSRGQATVQEGHPGSPSWSIDDYAPKQD